MAATAGLDLSYPTCVDVVRCVQAPVPVFCYAGSAKK